MLSTGLHFASESTRSLFERWFEEGRAVEIYAAVRRFIFIEGKSRREAARIFGLSPDTIAEMCRYAAPPGYV